jgi:pantoate--beta-alanine ligase
MPSDRELKLVKSPDEARELSLAAKREGKIIGLVPTMGALHEGHMSLVRQCREDCGLAIVSIYVNPTQFGEGEDLGEYPRTLDEDLAKCEAAGVDVVFAPSNSDVYQRDHSTWVEVGGLTNTMCGLSRPAHFRGVTTVVAKLLNICRPDRAYFGQKDLQQCTIIQRMVRDLNMPVEIVRMPIVREQDGLAMSSRNSYLSPEERDAALCLHQALVDFEEKVARGERSAGGLLEAMAGAVIAEPGATLDYAALVDTETLEDVSEITGEIAATLGVWIGDTRLIDNVIVRDGRR